MHDARLLSPEFALHQPHERGAEVRSRPRPQRRVESKVGLPTLDRLSEHDRIASISGFATDPIDGEAFTRTVRQPSVPFALPYRAAFISKTPALATEKTFVYSFYQVFCCIWTKYEGGGFRLIAYNLR